MPIVSPCRTPSIEDSTTMDLAKCTAPARSGPSVLDRCRLRRAPVSASRTAAASWAGKSGERKARSLARRVDGREHPAAIAEAPHQLAQRAVERHDVAFAIRRIGERLDRFRQALQRRDARSGGVQLAVDFAERVGKRDQRRPHRSFRRFVPSGALGLSLRLPVAQVGDLFRKCAKPRRHLHRRLLIWTKRDHA